MKQEAYDDFAKLLLSSFDEDDLAIMAFGMIPERRLTPFLKTIWDATADKAISEGEAFEGLDKETALGMISKKWKREFENNLCKALYRNAKMVV